MPQSSRGTSRMRSRSIFTGSCSRVSPSRWDSLRTCVSTTMPWGSRAPRRRHRWSSAPRRQPHELLDASRHPAVELLEQHPHRPAQRLGLLAEESRCVNVALQLLLRDGKVVLGFWYLRNASP